MPPPTSVDLGQPVRDWVAGATEALDAEGNVHDARRLLKKARAALRLAEGWDGGDAVRRARILLRDAGRDMAAIRDVQAAAEFLRASSSMAPTTSEVAARLEAREAELRTESLPEVRRQVGQRVSAARDLLGSEDRTLPLDVVHQGLAESRERLRRASALLASGLRGAALHELRKRAKDLRYQLEMLEAEAIPAGLRGQATVLRALTDDLGWIQDLHIVRVQLAVPEEAESRRSAAAVLASLRGLRGERVRRAVARADEFLEATAESGGEPSVPGRS